MEFVPIVAALALVWKIVDFIKYLSNLREYKSSVVAQLSVWAGGIIVTFLLASSDFAAGIQIGELPLEQLNGASLLLFGLSIGSSGSVLYDFKKARDNTDSAQTPEIIKS